MITEEFDMNGLWFSMRRGRKKGGRGVDFFETTGWYLWFGKEKRKKEKVGGFGKKKMRVVLESESG